MQSFDFLPLHVTSRCRKQVLSRAADNPEINPKCTEWPRGWFCRGSVFIYAGFEGLERAYQCGLHSGELPGEIGMKQVTLASQENEGRNCRKEAGHEVQRAERGLIQQP